MEQLLGRQTWAAGGLAVGAEKVHPCFGAILHRPGEEEVDLWGMKSSWHLSTCGHCISQILCFSLLEPFIVSLPGHTLSPRDLRTSGDFCLEVASLLSLAISWSSFRCKLRHPPFFQEPSQVRSLFCNCSPAHPLCEHALPVPVPSSR